MKIYKGVESFQRLSKAVVTTGTFDGVHLGHAKMLNKLVEIGQENQSETVLMTFFPHPRIVLFPDHDLKLINDIDENIELFKKYNIDHLIIQNFDKEFSRITSLDYIRDILIKKVGLKNLVIGFNHHFGRNREGSLENLSEYSDLYDFDIHQVDSYSIDKKSISSTKIRNAINLGDVQLANNYLGYSFTFSGIVSKGKGRGKAMGFPTANIILENKNKIIPKFGVYAVNILYNKIRYKGMLNIGMNPTFNNQEPSIEVHIFDFNKEIYGSKLSVELIDRIRNEKKFNNPDELKNQLAIDKIASLNIL